MTAAVALVKNGQVVRTDEVSLASATGKNVGVLDGLDYKSKAGGLASGETWVWSIAYPLDKLTQPFECEVSVTDYRQATGLRGRDRLCLVRHFGLSTGQPPPRSARPPSRRRQR